MGRIADEEREKLYVRLDKKNEQILYINSGDFIPKNRKCVCTNEAQNPCGLGFFQFCRKSENNYF